MKQKNNYIFPTVTYLIYLYTYVQGTSESSWESEIRKWAYFGVRNVESHAFFKNMHFP